MIDIKELRVGYNHSPVTTIINGHIAAGSMTAIVGENGCGKSTLLKTLAGFLPPVNGCIIWPHGRPVIGWLAQRNTLESDFPIVVQDVVSMGLWPRVSLFRSMHCRERLRIAAALERVGLLHLAKSPVETLSGGQFQRMLFTRVWLQQAPLVMLDEPLTGVDENTSNVLMSLIEEMHQRGQTILAVLHDTPRVQRHFPCVLRLESERCVWQTLAYKECVA
ncbi:TPA: metal ABC transporter ATP-binding protein [Escherichia coli]